MLRLLAAARCRMALDHGRCPSLFPQTFELELF